MPVEKILDAVAVVVGQVQLMVVVVDLYVLAVVVLVRVVVCRPLCLLRLRFAGVVFFGTSGTCLVDGVCLH